MREILFRGKRIDNGEWVEGAFLNDRDGAFYICPAVSDISYGDGGNRRRIGCWYKVDHSTGSFEWFKELSKRYFGGGYFYHYEADGITRQQLKEAQEQGFIKYSYYSNWQARQLNQTEYWCLTNKGLKALYKAYQGQW